jgi:DNA-binding transcriptional LysR family regulator
VINLNRFDLASLRLFVAVVDAGSLASGAERFGISLAAAGKRISELEHQCGTPLLLRSKRGVAPTPAGQALHANAIGVVAQVEKLALAMDDFRRGAAGHLRMWANTSAFAGFLPRLLAAYSAAHPDVAIDLEDALSEDAARAVASGAAELAVVGENTPIGNLQTMLCDTDELALLVPQDHPLANLSRVSLATALELDFITLNRAHSLVRQISEAAEFANRTLKIRVQVPSFDAMCHMVAAGLGVAILPRAGAAPHLKSMRLKLIGLEGMPTERRLLLVMRERDALSAAAKALVEMVERVGARTHFRGSVDKAADS